MGKEGHNGHNGHGRVRETPDVSHIQNVDVTHESSDVNIGGILKFVVGLTIFGIIVQVLTWGMFRFFNAQEKEPPQGPMAMTKEERLPPEPRLQSAPGFGVKLVNGQWVTLEKSEPQAEYRVLREQWDRQLNCRGGDEKHGDERHSEENKLVTPQPGCMPIDAAIQKLFEGQGLPVRSQEKSSGNPELALPTAASSGRVTGKDK